MADISKINLPDGTTNTIKDDTKLPLTGGTLTGNLTLKDAYLYLIDANDNVKGMLWIGGLSDGVFSFYDSNGDVSINLEAEAGKVSCKEMSWTNETVTFSKSSGSWTFRDGEYTRSGQVVQLRLAFHGGSSNVSVGSNAIAGTVHGIPTPPYTVRLQGYYSGTALMGELTATGGFNVRVLGQALNLSSSNTATLSGTFVVED